MEGRSMITALYAAQGGETVFSVGDVTRITVAEGDDPIVGRIGGLSGWVDAYICWVDDKPSLRVPAWSVMAQYEEDKK